MYETQKIAERFQSDAAGIELKPSYNIAPGQSLPVVTRNSPNKLEIMKWGLVPSWADDVRIGYKMLNARGETVAEKPAFRSAFKSRRCLVPTNGYYEWKKEAGHKVPYLFRLKGGGLFSFAGLYERWHAAEGNELSTYTVITTRPNTLAEQVHDRMPVILQPGAEDAWLNSETPVEQLLGLLVPYPEEDMEAFPVSSDVNKPVNNSEALVLPINSK